MVRGIHLMEADLILHNREFGDHCDSSLALGCDGHVQGSRCAIAQVGLAIRALPLNHSLILGAVQCWALATLGDALVVEGFSSTSLEALMVRGIHLMEADLINRCEDARRALRQCEHVLVVAGEGWHLCRVVRTVRSGAVFISQAALVATSVAHTVLAVGRWALRVFGTVSNTLKLRILRDSEH